MTKLAPDTIATRTLLVLILGLTISHVLSVSLYHLDRADALASRNGEHVAERIATVTQLAENAGSAERKQILELSDGHRLHATLSDEPGLGDDQETGVQARVLREALAHHFSQAPTDAIRVRQLAAGMENPWEGNLWDTVHDEAGQGLLLASIPLRDGSWINFTAPIDPPEPFWSLRFVLSMAVMLIAVFALSAVVVQRMIDPLRAFAAAATRLGHDVRAPELAERGPREVRDAIRAFNQMQSRIRRFVEDRTEMLAAIAHDLGTPITRLRLRAEFVEDEELQTKMLSDLDDMERMVSSSLAFARQDFTEERRVTVDLRSLLERVCDDETDTGGEVTLDLPDEPVRLHCQPAAVRRALANLVDNAVKYGRRARVSLEAKQGLVSVLVDDDGSGIPAEYRDQAFRPFRRLEGSRNKDTGGTGLGLAVARTIARAHGGDIELRNRCDGGLRAELKLPT